MSPFFCLWWWIQIVPMFSWLTWQTSLSLSYHCYVSVPFDLSASKDRIHQATWQLDPHGLFILHSTWTIRKAILYYECIDNLSFCEWLSLLSILFSFVSQFCRIGPLSLGILFTRFSSVFWLDWCDVFSDSNIVITWLNIRTMHYFTLCVSWAQVPILLLVLPFPCCLLPNYIFVPIPIPPYSLMLIDFWDSLTDLHIRLIGWLSCQEVFLVTFSAFGAPWSYNLLLS